MGIGLACPACRRSVVSRDSVGAFEGEHALRITFDGSPTSIMFTCSIRACSSKNAVTDFRAICACRGSPLTAGSDPVCDAYNLGNIFVSSENLVGTSGWSEQHAEFTTSADTRLLLVRVVRPVAPSWTAKSRALCGSMMFALPRSSSKSVIDRFCAKIPADGACVPRPSLH